MEILSFKILSGLIKGPKLQSLLAREIDVPYSAVDIVKGELVDSGYLEIEATGPVTLKITREGKTAVLEHWRRAEQAHPRRIEPLFFISYGKAGSPLLFLLFLSVLQKSIFELNA